jgi:hypothetical protein
MVKLLRDIFQVYALYLQQNKGIIKTWEYWTVHWMRGLNFVKNRKKAREETFLFYNIT